MTQPHPVPPAVLKTSDLQVLTNGAVRDVFHRPDSPRMLLKTHRPHKRTIYERRPGLIARLKRRYTLGPYKPILVEYRCYLRAARMAERHGRPNPIAELGGVVPTDHGLAQVCVFVTDGQGGAARTLRLILKDGPPSPDMLNRLNAFVDDVYALGVVAPDLSAANIVYDGAEGRFVLIDGFGDKTFVPLRSLFPRLNHRQLEDRFARLAKGRPIVWEPERRRFAVGASADQ